MKRRRIRYSKQVRELIIFLAGVSIPAVVSGLIDAAISWSEASLIFLSVAMAIFGIFYFSQSDSRIQALADRMETTVYYVDEPYREEEGVRFRGLAYSELGTLVSQAKNEILALSTTSIEGKKDKTTDHPSRQRYLSAIEHAISKRMGSGFKYVRIIQVPRLDNGSPLSEHLGQSASRHCRNVLEMERKAKAGEVSLSIMKVPKQMQGAFVIVDRRYLVVEASGIDTKGDPYAAGMFFLEDKEGTLINRFVWYFENFVRQAQMVSSQDLG